MKFSLPFYNEGKYPITQYFGAKYIYQGKMATHEGVDWAMPKGTPIIAPFSGTVVRITPLQTNGYGKAIYLLADNEENGKIEALVAHLDVIGVELGWRVKESNVIGLSGNSGFWIGHTGYHLHFGIKQNGHYIDPLQFYKKIPFQNQAVNLFNQDNPADGKFLPSHTVQPGDTLWAISKKYYSSGAKFNQIFLANQDIIKNPWKIFPGQVLKIPDIENKKI